jgi:hypothetical protein
MVKLNPIWGSKRMAALDGRQVRCTTFDEGSVWIHDLDKLPTPVRRRLAEGVFNLCPTCVYMDARHEARRRGLLKPTVAVYFDVIRAIERILKSGEPLLREHS